MAKKPTENNHKGSKDYSAEDITVMEGLEAVRKRPGMYIGTTGVEGVQHLIHEIVDNGVDEAMAGFASKITVRNLLEHTAGLSVHGYAGYESKEEFIHITDLEIYNKLSKS